MVYLLTLHGSVGWQNGSERQTRAGRRKDCCGDDSLWSRPLENMQPVGHSEDELWSEWPGDLKQEYWVLAR